MRRGSLPVAGLVRDDTGTAGRVEVWWPSEGHATLVSTNVIAPAWQVGQQVWLQGTAGLVVSRVICNSGLVGYGVRCWSVRKQELGKVRAEVAHGDLRQREVSRGRACTSSSWRLPPRGGVMARAMCTQGAGVVTREALEVGTACIWILRRHAYARSGGARQTWCLTLSARPVCVSGGAAFPLLCQA